jgi:sulfur relay (sulfurtransferase) DsrC/TusE family protein
VDKYFDRMFFVNDTKEHVIGELLAKTDEDETWFIDNEIKQVYQMYKIYPRLKVVIKANEHIDKEKYEHARLAYFYNLLEIADYVRN